MGFVTVMNENIINSRLVDRRQRLPLNSGQLARLQDLGWEWAVDEVRGQPRWPIINSIPAAASAGGTPCRHTHKLSSALEGSGKFTTAALGLFVENKDN